MTIDMTFERREEIREEERKGNPKQIEELKERADEAERKLFEAQKRVEELESMQNTKTGNF